MPSTRTKKNRIPKTGQLTSYSDYDDGYYHDKNGSPVDPRFVDLGKNTIYDRVQDVEWFKRPELIIPTGLNADDVGVEKGDYVQDVDYAAGDIVTDPGDGSVQVCIIACHTTEADFGTERTNYGGNWQQTFWAQSNGGGGVNPAYMPWDAVYGGTPNNALDLCHAISKGGKSDWRLPTVKELVGLVDYGRVYPAIDPLFVNCQSDYYWTSTIYADYTGYAWIVYFVVGGVGSGYRYGGYYVRPCRQYSN